MRMLQWAGEPVRAMGSIPSVPPVCRSSTRGRGLVTMRTGPGPAVTLIPGSSAEEEPRRRSVKRASETALGRGLLGHRL